jgi:hypothetical protein
MDEQAWLAQGFEANRAHLRAVAYRMLGSPSEADDAVQEAWLRLSRSDTSGVENLGGWLTTVVARVCLNMLAARSSRREEPLGVHLPDPAGGPEHGIDPDVVLRADPAAVQAGAAGEVRGAREVAGTFSGRARFARPALVDGAAGAVWAPGGQPRVVFGFTIADGRVVEIELLADPERLRQLDLAILDD